MIRSYRVVPSSIELAQGVLLLRAAGIDATIELPDSALPPSLDERIRSQLRASASQLLNEAESGPVVLRLAYEGDSLQLRVLRSENVEAVA